MISKLHGGITVAVGVSLAVVVAAPFFGATGLGLPNTGGDAAVAANIFWNIRIPRVLAGFFTGAGLGLAGMVFQALFRNALATPYTLGVASGASFGSTLAMICGWAGSAGTNGALQLAGLVGALCATALVYFLSKSCRQLTSAGLLLAGVAITFFFSSMILFLQYLSDFAESFHVVRWLMGGLQIVGYQSLAVLVVFVVLGSTLVFCYLRELDIISTGDELSYARGVDTERVRTVLFIGVSLMVGVIVSVTGPIGFIGMMVPHTARLLLGAQHTRLAPAVLLFAGAFLVACDAIARTLIAPAEIPVGVLTAMLGGPFFLMLLLYRRDV